MSMEGFGVKEITGVLTLNKQGCGREICFRDVDGLGEDEDNLHDYQLLKNAVEERFADVQVDITH